MKNIIIALSFIAFVSIININCVSSSSHRSPTVESLDSLGGILKGGIPDKQLITGADQTSEYLDYLKGKKVGILVNQTSIIGKTPIVDSLVALGVNVVRIFGPEHGFRGTASNGDKVNIALIPKLVYPQSLFMENKRDQRTSKWLIWI